MDAKFSKEEMEEVTTLAKDTLELIKNANIESEKIEVLIDMYAKAYKTGMEDGVLQVVKIANDKLYSEE